MTSRRTLAFLALIGAGALALSGCASDMESPAGVPDDSSNELEVDAGWLDGGRIVALVTRGSSSCVPTASDVTVQADGSVAVTLVDPEGKACTRDMAPRATLVQLPEGVTGEVELVVTYGPLRGDADLDAYAGGTVDEFTPSAGWIDDNQLVVLTWGSSGCPPVVQDAAAEGGQITVTFVDPPADQICTADMAPRATLVEIPGVDDDVVDLTLTGGDFATPLKLQIAS